MKFPIGWVYCIRLLGLQILMPVILEHLCENGSPPLTIYPLLKLPCCMSAPFCWGICLNNCIGFSLLNFLPIRANICSCWRYRNRIRAGKMALTVDGNRPIKVDLRMKFLVAWKFPGIVETNVLIFLWKGQSHFLCIYYYAQKLFVSQSEELVFWGRS